MFLDYNIFHVFFIFVYSVLLANNLILYLNLYVEKPQENMQFGTPFQDKQPQVLNVHFRYGSLLNMWQNLVQFLSVIAVSMKKMMLFTV